MRNGGLERVEAIIERQERVAPKGDDDGLLLAREHRGARLLGTGALVLDRGALLPLGHRLRVDAVALGQHPQALLTMLDRSTDRLCRAGAPMKNLAHSASFHSGEKNAPSNPGTKHLAKARSFWAQAARPSTAFSRIAAFARSPRQPSRRGFLPQIARSALWATV